MKWLEAWREPFAKAAMAARRMDDLDEAIGLQRIYSALYSRRLETYEAALQFVTPAFQMDYRYVRSIAKAANVVVDGFDQADIGILMGTTMASPGYVAINGPRLPSSEGGRIYLAARASRLNILLPRLIDVLVEGDVPFRLKFLATPFAYDRSDSVVVYTEPEILPMAAAIFSAHPEWVGRCVRDSIPLLTRQVARGVAIAPSIRTIGGAWSRLSYGLFVARLVRHKARSDSDISTIESDIRSYCERDGLQFPFDLDHWRGN